MSIVGQLLVCVLDVGSQNNYNRRRVRTFFNPLFWVHIISKLLKYQHWFSIEHYSFTSFHLLIINYFIYGVLGKFKIGLNISFAFRPQSSAPLAFETNLHRLKGDIIKI